MPALPEDSLPAQVPPVSASTAGDKISAERIRTASILSRVGHGVHGLGLLQCLGGTELAAGDVDVFDVTQKLV